MNVRFVVRGALLALTVACFAAVAGGYLAAAETASDPEAAFEEGERAVDPPGATTVITTSQSGNNYIVAFDPDGGVIHYDDRYAFYNEVERVPETRSTVIYVATEQLDRDACDATTPCNRNVIERLNLTTGERDLLYERTNPRARNQWHAIALLNDSRVVVGDIAYDRVFVLDTERDLIEWEWEAQSDYDLDSGGVYPGDWTHLNDVEVLPDGRIMVSLRNHDQVVFLDRERGLQREWALGADDDHDTLYEQHNPDYIPESGGGPAVLVADSENNRIVEYEREGDGWRETWDWSDAEMRWPRDADRLSNGHTVIVDSNGGRVLEIDRDGEVVWTVEIAGAYDVERFDGAADGEEPETAARLGLESRTEGDRSARENVPDPRAVPRGSVAVLEAVLPSVVVNGLLYVLPPWFGVFELGATLLLFASATAWAALELRWRGYRLRSPIRRGGGFRE